MIHIKQLLIMRMMILFIVFMPIAGSAEHDSFMKPFTVRDGIDRTKLYYAFNDDESGNRNFFVTNDSQTKILYITGTGDHRENTYHFKLLYFNTSDIKNHLSGSLAAPISPAIIAETKFNQNEPAFLFLDSAGIKKVKFYADDRIIFLMTNENGVYQIYEFNFSSKILNMITSGSDHVIDYEIDKSTGDIVFTKADYPGSDHCSKLSFSVIDMVYEDTICFNNGQSYLTHLRASKPRIDSNLSIYKINIDKYSTPILLSVHNKYPVNLGSVIYKLRSKDNDKKNINKAGRSENVINGHRSNCKYSNDGFTGYIPGEENCSLNVPKFGLRILTGEAIDRSPDVIASDLSTGRSAVIHRLNPQFSRIHFGRVKVAEWEDEKGVKWRGGLVYPPNYDKKRVYPIVIQVYSSGPDAFLVDGPWFSTAPFAAQAIANRDIIVLQIMGSDRLEYKNPEHFQPQLARGVNAAIKKLIESNIIDPEKIGLIGYSATGRFVFNMAAFPEFVPAAIVVGDAYSPTPFGYARYYDENSQYTIDAMEAMYCNALPWGHSQKEWIRRQAFFSLDKISSAVLFQDYSFAPPAWWDVLVGLKRLDKVVDYHLFNGGKHPPLLPSIILQAQEMVVDWFDFWLNERNIENKNYAKEWLKMKKVDVKRVGSSNLALSRMDCGDD